jgi:tetratricopeptide (TPR) repeat protein
MRPHGLIAAALVAAVFAVYAQVRSHEFVDFDDPVYLSTIRRGFCSEEIVGAWTEATAANWIPVTVTSLLLDRELYGDAPAGYLLTNTALHAASTALLFLTFAAATGSVWPSAFVAATFGLHPLHVESVAWFSQRKDVLCALFWILTLAAHLHYARRPSAARYALVLLGAVLGLLSKPMMVTVPFTLLLLDYWPLRRLQLGKPRSLGRPAIEKLPLLALALAVGAVTYSVQDAAGAIAPEDAIPLGARIANAIESYVAYLWNAVWPVHLAAYYPHPRAAFSAARVAAAGAVLAAATIAAARCAAARPYALVGWLWFLVTLAPVIGIVQVGQQARADRYTYVPLIGVAIIAAWRAADLAQRGARARRAVAAAGVVSIAAMTVVSWQQVKHWKNSTALFGRAVAVTRSNAIAHDGLGRALRSDGRAEEAAAQLGEAIRLRPGWAKPRIDLAELLLEQRRVDAAIDQYASAVRIDPRDLRTRVNLASLLVRNGRRDAARPHLAFCVAELRRGAALADPFRGALHEALAEVQDDRGRAIAHYREALSIDPRRTRAANRLAWLLATSPDLEPDDAAEAVRLAEAAALHTDYRDPIALDTLAAAYAAQGRSDAAIDHAARALRLAQERADSRHADALRARLDLYRDGHRYVER